MCVHRTVSFVRIRPVGPDTGLSQSLLQFCAMAKISMACVMVLGFVAACAGEDRDGGGGGGGGDSTGRYMPLDEGASWTYRVTDVGDGTVTTKTQSVEAFEDIGGMKAGIMAFRLRREKDNGYTLSWQEDTGDAVVRHREESYDATDAMESEDWFDPGKLRIDESEGHTALDATFADDYTETTIDHTNAGEMTMTTKAETWVVQAVDDEVDVPAGTFTCLKLFRSNDGTGVAKTYWFARGVGKVKESGGSQIEELSDYTLP